MMLVIDSNILLASLIRDSTVRKIIVESGWNFFYPQASFHEIRKYKELVLEKSGMDEKEYIRLLNQVLHHVKLDEEEKIKGYIKEANNVLGAIDPDDVVFLATALAIDNAKIWSDDIHLEKQDKVRVFTTKHLANTFFPAKK